jgi:hypothetical protein
LLDSHPPAHFFHQQNEKISAHAVQKTGIENSNSAALTNGIKIA